MDQNDTGCVSERKKKKARFTIIYHNFRGVTQEIIPIYS